MVNDKVDGWRQWEYPVLILEEEIGVTNQEKAEIVAN